MVLIEALAVGCPCVCTNYDAAQNIIQDGVNGWLVKMEPIEIYERIVSLIKNPDALISVKMNCEKSCKYLNMRALESFFAIMGDNNGKD